MINKKSIELLEMSSNNLSPTNFSDEKCLEELKSPSSLNELNLILSKISRENPSSELFKGKYQFIILNDLCILKSKPLETVVVICGVKPKKLSESGSNNDEVFSDDFGSPLSLQFDSLLPVSSGDNLSFSTLQYLQQNCDLYPLSLNIGRKLLFMCNSIENDNVNIFPVLIICHGKNPKAVEFLGTWKKDKNERFFIKNEGLVTKQEQLPRLSFLKENHLRGFPPLFNNIETSVYARYDFIDTDCEENAILKPVKDANLYIECFWNNTLSILEPVAEDSSCFAKIKAVGGNRESGAFCMYKEIELIEALHQSLQTGMMTWANPEADHNILARVREFINSEKSILFKSEKSVPVDDQDVTLEQTVLEGRAKLDFTEKLWNILKDCSSTEELIKAITFVYNAFGDFLARPFVFQENKSTIAMAVKNMMEKLILCPVLESKLTLELLLEIGIEKLRRDYVMLFLGLKLIPKECLNYYLQPKLLSLEAITCLKKLHSVLELAILCVKCLGLSKQHLSTFVRNALQYYTTVPDIDFQYEFTFQIPTVNARKLLDPMRPSAWEISLISCVNDFMKQSVHRYQTIPVSKHIYAPKNYNPKLMLKTASYTYLNAIFIQDNWLQDED